MTSTSTLSATAVPEVVAARATTTIVMTRIRLHHHADPSTALSTGRETFLSRGHLWEPTGELTAVAGEGGEPIANDALSRTLRVVAEIDPGKNRVVPKQKTHGADYAGNGVPLFTVRLNLRFSKIVTSVREDLQAAGL